jgi:putative endonuclease
MESGMSRSDTIDMHVIYVIECPRTHVKYIGYTTDLESCLSEHTRRRNGATGQRTRWQLIYCEAYRHKRDAFAREKFFKTAAGWKFLKKQLAHYFEENVMSVLRSSPEQM